MATAANLKLTPAQCNMVHKNEIWKAHVYREHVTSKNWPQTWGFISDYYKQLRREIFDTRNKWYTNEPGTTEQETKDQEPLMSPVNEDRSFKLPPLPLARQDNSNPFPVTTAKEVGWRSGQKELNLEVFGRWARGNRSIHKQLNWPHDAIP